MKIEELNSLHTNQRLLLQELLSRGVDLKLLVKELELVEASYNGRRELLLDRDSSICPYASSVICAQKYVTKHFLYNQGISTPFGEQFYSDQREDALRFAEQLTYPLVVKPSFGSHGLGCSTDCYNIEDIENAIDHVFLHQPQEQAFLIERQHPGMEFRVFITRNGDYAVLHRDPAKVVGDGRLTIQQLIERESYRRMNPRVNCLCPIVIDVQVKQFLSRQGLSLSSIPASNQEIYLRRNSNIALGGTCEDFTEIAHQSTIKIAKQVLEIFPGLPYAGIDILAIDIAKPWSKETHVVLEVNSNPGIHMHMRPAKGKSQNVAAYIADLIFPETKNEFTC